MHRLCYQNATGARFCSRCGKPIQAAPRQKLRVLGKQERIAATRFTVAILAILGFCIAIPFLYGTSLLILAIVLSTFCIGWSLQRLSLRTKLASCGVMVVCVVLSQVIETRHAKALEVSQKEAEAKQREKQTLNAKVAAQKEAEQFAALSPREHLAAASSLLKLEADDRSQAIAYKHLQAAGDANKQAANAIKNRYLALQRGE